MVGKILEKWGPLNKQPHNNTRYIMGIYWVYLLLKGSWEHLFLRGAGEAHFASIRGKAWHRKRSNVKADAVDGSEIRRKITWDV